MTEQGVVLNCKERFIEVRIERNSACAKCGKCGMTENQKHVDFYVENSVNAVVGDVVELEIPDANTAGLAFIGYVLPLIPALVLMFVSIALRWKEWASLLMFFGGFIVGFALLALIDKRRKHKWAESPVVKSILKQNIKTESKDNE